MSPMHRLREILGDHPLAAFVILSYAISWSIMPLLGGLLGVGPFLAALVVLLAKDGPADLRQLLRRMIQWRVGGRWYAVALLLPAAVAGLAAVGAVALGADAPTTAQLSLWTQVPVTFAFVLIIPLLGPWEEPGFRGFALTRLRAHGSAVRAAAVIGAIHVGWHLPLFLTGDIPVADAVGVFAVSFVLAWLVIGAGGSVLLAMIMHAANNAISGDFVSPMFEGSDAALFGWIGAAVWSAIALIIVLRTGRELGSRRQRNRAPADLDSRSAAARASVSSLRYEAVRLVVIR